jgi:hypothetical protein
MNTLYFMLILLAIQKFLVRDLAHLVSIHNRTLYFLMYPFLRDVMPRHRVTCS